MEYSLNQIESRKRDIFGGEALEKKVIGNKISEKYQISEIYRNSE